MWHHNTLVNPKVSVKNLLGKWRGQFKCATSRNHSFFSKSLRMRSRRHILLRLKSRSMKEPRSLISILGDPGAVSRAGLKGATKVFKHGRKSPWVPTLTGPFPNGQENAGSWLGTKNDLYYCAQSANSISWVLFVSSFVHDGCYLAS